MTVQNYSPLYSPLPGKALGSPGEAGDSGWGKGCLPPPRTWPQIRSRNRWITFPHNIVHFFGPIIQQTLYKPAYKEFICDVPLSLLSLCSLLLLFSTISIIKTSTATTRMDVMVTTIFRPPLPDMLSEMGSPVFSSGGMVPLWKQKQRTGTSLVRHWGGLLLLFCELLTHVLKIGLSLFWGLKIKITFYCLKLKFILWHLKKILDLAGVFVPNSLPSALSVAKVIRFSAEPALLVTFICSSYHVASSRSYRM